MSAEEREPASGTESALQRISRRSAVSRLSCTGSESPQPVPASARPRVPDAPVPSVIGRVFAAAAGLSRHAPGN